uniref:Uncharacterized protein n=1 Tax=Panagrellus redivivus TaxID=6233 RepID=A0A7E4VU98_PANRE
MHYHVYGCEIACYWLFRQTYCHPPSGSALTPQFKVSVSPPRVITQKIVLVKTSIATANHSKAQPSSRMAEGSSSSQNPRSLVARRPCRRTGIVPLCVFLFVVASFGLLPLHHCAQLSCSHPLFSDAIFTHRDCSCWIASVFFSKSSPERINWSVRNGQAISPGLICLEGPLPYHQRQSCIVLNDRCLLIFAPLGTS